MCSFTGRKEEDGGNHRVPPSMNSVIASGSARVFAPCWRPCKRPIGKMNGPRFFDRFHMYLDSLTGTPLQLMK